jgi:hypothetical protein
MKYFKVQNSYTKGANQFKFTSKSDFHQTLGQKVNECKTKIDEYPRKTCYNITSTINNEIPNAYRNNNKGSVKLAISVSYTIARCKWRDGGTNLLYPNWIFSWQSGSLCRDLVLSSLWSVSLYRLDFHWSFINHLYAKNMDCN